jgi:hypothetical protein
MNAGNDPGRRSVEHSPEAPGTVDSLPPLGVDDYEARRKNLKRRPDGEPFLIRCALRSPRLRRLVRRRLASRTHPMRPRSVPRAKQRPRARRVRGARRARAPGRQEPKPEHDDNACPLRGEAA